MKKTFAALTLAATLAFGSMFTFADDGATGNVDNGGIIIFGIAPGIIIFGNASPGIIIFGVASPGIIISD